MTRTRANSDRRHDNDPSNDTNNESNNTSDTTNTTKRVRRVLHDTTTADESASEFGVASNATNNNKNDDEDEKLNESTFVPESAQAAVEEDAQLPQFIASLHELISDPATSHVVTWLPLPDGRVHFVVKDVDLFTQNILPKYYRTHKMTSFMRQLNNYGFSKVKSTDQNDKTYEFEHESNQLQPDRPDLLFKIERRRAVKRGSPAHGVKRSRPSGQQLFRTTVNAVPSSASLSPASLSPRGHHAAAAATDFERHVVQAMRVLPGAMPVEGEDDDGDESAAASGPAKRRPLRSASLAARNAIKAAVQEYDDNGDAAAAPADDDGATDGGGGAADESSEFDDTQSASEQQQSPRASMSQLALVERGRTQLNRLRLHEEQPLSLERVPSVPQLTTLANADDITIEPFSFTVPQVPAATAGTASTAFAFRLAPSVATAQNQPPQVVVQARVGLTKSGEVWKSMIQSTIVEPSTTPTPAVLFDLPRNNSVTDFFGIKREATTDADDTGIMDDTRAFLKSSAGINI